MSQSPTSTKPKYYYIQFVQDGKLCNGATYEVDDDMQTHILGFLENYPGELYDVVILDEYIIMEP